MLHVLECLFACWTYGGTPSLKTIFEFKPNSPQIFLNKWWENEKHFIVQVVSELLKVVLCVGPLLRVLLRCCFKRNRYLDNLQVIKNQEHSFIRFGTRLLSNDHTTTYCGKGFGSISLFKKIDVIWLHQLISTQMRLPYKLLTMGLEYSRMNSITSRKRECFDEKKCKRMLTRKGSKWG